MILAAALAMAVAASHPGIDRPVPPGGTAGPCVSLGLDNDHFNFWQKPDRRPDFGYTHGTVIAARLPRAGEGIARRLPATLVGGPETGGVAALELRLRQDIYSPWNIYDPGRPGPDRAYAGWLEVAVGVSRGSGDSWREVLLHVGVTGPPSLAGAVQRSLHETFHQSAPPDWSNQLPAEPGFGLEAGGARVLARSADSNPWAASIAAHHRARLSTYAIDFRLGGRLLAGWNPPGRPSPHAARPFMFYVKADPKLDLIARDEFLDGGLFRDGPEPAPGARPLVAESEAGVGAGVAGLRLEWSVHRRSREFDGQPRPHTYGSIALTWEP